MRLAGVLVALAAASSPANAQDALTLWYRQPAKLWVEALPVGNGRLGAMVFGGIAQERIQFNESTVWSGEPRDYSHLGAYQSLGKLRELLWAGKQQEAHQLANREFMSIPLRQKAYQAFGDLELEIPGVREYGITGYRRELNLDTGIAAVQFTHQGVTYRREVFASYPANVIVVRLTPGRYNARLKNAHTGATGATSIRGEVKDGAIRFAAGITEVRDSQGRTLILAGATNFKNYRDVSADPQARIESALAAALRKGYSALRAEHIADHQRLFRRVSIDLGTTAASKLPTDERIAKFAAGSDPALVALVFQYGRYLLIGSSRPDGQPANVQ